MTRYAAVLPDFLPLGDYEALTGLGEVAHVYIGNHADRRTAVRELSEEHGWRGLDSAFWEEALQARPDGPTAIARARGAERALRRIRERAADPSHPEELAEDILEILDLGGL